MSIVWCRSSPGIIPGVTKYTALNIAIADGPGEVHLSVYEKHCASVVFRSLENDSAKITSVSNVGLGEFIDRSGTSHIALHKCDIEGAKLAVFRAATDAALMSIELISIKFHDFLDSTQRPFVDEIVARLHGLGFFSIDFSRNRMDMLFVNQRYLPL